MKKESIKKKLSFKKTFVANLNENAANSIVGGADNSSVWWPCACTPDTRAPNVCYSRNCATDTCPPDSGLNACDSCVM